MTIRQTRLVRVFRGPNGVGACWRASGRRIALWTEDEYNSGGLDAVAGPFVAYDSQSYPTCKDACPPGVNGTSDTEVVNVHNRHRRDLGQLASAVALARSGAIAWLVSSAPRTSELWLWDRHGRRKLDSGDIPGKSLRIGGGRLHWTNAGQPKSTAVA